MHIVFIRCIFLKLKLGSTSLSYIFIQSQLVDMHAMNLNSYDYGAVIQESL